MTISRASVAAEQSIGTSSRQSHSPMRRSFLSDSRADERDWTGREVTDRDRTGQGAAGQYEVGPQDNRHAMDPTSLHWTGFGRERSTGYAWVRRPLDRGPGIFSCFFLCLEKTLQSDSQQGGYWHLPPGRFNEGKMHTEALPLLVSYWSSSDFLGLLGNLGGA